MSEHEKSHGMGGLLTELGVVAPESNALATLSNDQQIVINAYRSGKMDEADFRQRLSTDPALAEYVRSSSVARDG